MSIELRDDNGKLRKDLNGQLIYGVPTGNNISRVGRYANQALMQVATFKVEKVGVKYLSLRRISMDGTMNYFTDKYCPDSGACVGQGVNSGYHLFDSKERLEQYIRSISVRETLDKELRGMFGLNLMKYSDEQLEKVAEILNIEINLRVNNLCPAS